MAVEKIGMLAQVSHHLAGTDFARPRRRGPGGADRLRLILRTVGHVYARGLAATAGPEEHASKWCAIIRKPPKPYLGTASGAPGRVLATRRSASEFSRCPTIIPVPLS